MKTKDLNVQIKWSSKYSAVEIVSICDSRSRELYIDFLAIDQDIKDLLLLEYTNDGVVLSAKEYAASVSEWEDLAVKNLSAKVGKNHLISIPVESNNRSIVFNSSSNTWSVCNRNGSYSGFSTKLQAEWFQLRLWNDNGFTYFLLDGSDQEILDLKKDEFSNRIRLAELSSRMDYGDMSWSICSEDGEICGSLDFEALPD